MKKRYTRATLKSFSKLRTACESVWPKVGLSAAEPINMPDPPIEKACGSEEINDSQLFTEAVQDIKPLESTPCQTPVEELVERGVVEAVIEIEPVEKLKNLDKLLSNGIGCELRSPESFSRNAGKLHSFRNDLCRGCGCSFCNSLDLHGHTVAEAKVAFDKFLEESALLARSSVLIIHGRGLSSAGEPILKNMVKKWLERGLRQNLWHSFSGAMPEDGGEGATYVQLYGDD